MYLRPFVIGAATFIPGIRQLLTRKGTGSTSSATYCYEVWLKHLVLLWAHGMRSIPHCLAELGPGNSLGVGLAAMLCGVDRYVALDVVSYSNPRVNLAVFDELVDLFQKRAPRSTRGWPNYDAHLDENLFASAILSDAVLERSLAPSRIDRIRAILEERDGRADEITITYQAPWYEDGVIEQQSVDLILSHAVLQSVFDLERTYAALGAWLKPGGFMSHQIDFTSFRTSRQWNGHWGYSDPMWQLIVGKRPYLINREPHSTHLQLLRKHGFEVLCDLQNHRHEHGISRSQLSSRWAHIAEDDFTCAGAFVQARKHPVDVSLVAQAPI